MEKFFAELFFKKATSLVRSLSPINQNLNNRYYLGGSFSFLFLILPEIVKKITNFSQNFAFAIYNCEKICYNDHVCYAAYGRDSFKKGKKHGKQDFG